MLMVLMLLALQGLDGFISLKISNFIGGFPRGKYDLWRGLLS